MSGEQNNFNVSQEFEIIPHQKGQAYPIGVKEWEYLKEKINTNIYFFMGDVDDGTT